MKFVVIGSFIFFLVISCKQEKQANVPSNPAASIEKVIRSVKVDRHTVIDNNPENLAIASRISRTFGPDGNEKYSTFFTSDYRVVMKFFNQYDGNKKILVDWMDDQNQQVKYVENIYDENDLLIRSRTYLPDGTYESGFDHRWKDDGRVEERSPIIDGRDFKPIAIYTYNDKNEFESLKEYDMEGKPTNVVRWEYIKNDEYGNWLERHMITNDKINMVEKRVIFYH